MSPATRFKAPWVIAVSTIAGAAVVLFIAGMALFIVRDVRQRQAEQREIAARMAVRVLPPGAREAWVAYVHRRVSRAVTRNLADVSLLEVGGVSKRVPLGTPFDVECDALKGSGAVIFKPASQTVVVPVFGPPEKPGQTAETEPPLGVHRQSPAAIGLSDLLCKTIVDDVRAITGRDSPAPEQG
jgi:hypothetical protein